MHVAAHHCVAFPVTDAAAQFDFQRSLADGPLAGQHAPGIVAAIAFAPELAEDPGVAPQVAASLFVPADLAVDGLVTDAQAAGPPPNPGDLLGAEFTAHQA